jgi:diguanylate cyclase (GGDEF)-like protein
MRSGPAVRRHLESAPAPAVVFAAVALGALVAALDVTTGPDVSTSYFYVVPLVIATWRFGRAAGTATAIAAAGLWLLIDVSTGPSQSLSIPTWNAVVRLAFFLTITLLLAGLHAAMTRESELARIDPLTGIANRRAFADAAARELARIQRSGDRLTVAVVDLDHLKRINDTAGHAGGDDALVAVANVLRSTLRASDLVARLGGDEFAFLVSGRDVDVETLLERIRRGVAAESVAGHWLSCSIGAVTVGDGSLDEWLSMADGALYDAKRSGRDTVVVFPDIVRVHAPSGSTGDKISPAT